MQKQGPAAMTSPDGDERRYESLTEGLLTPSFADVDPSYMPMSRSLATRKASLEVQNVGTQPSQDGHHAAGPYSSGWYKTDIAHVSSSPMSFKACYYHSELADSDQLFFVMEPYMPRNGFFLLRDSFTKPGRLTISVTHDGGVKHFNVAVTDGMYNIDEKRLFCTIDDLVTFYGANEVRNQEGIGNIRLMFPIIPQSAASSKAREPPVDYRAQNIAPFENHLSGNNDRGQPLVSESGTPHQAVKKQSTFKKVKNFFKPEKRVPSSVPQRSASVSTVPTFGASELASTGTRTNKSFKPPAPLPPDTFHQISPNNLSSSNSDVYYSQARDLDCQLSGVLISCLRREEVDGLCHCGLSYDEATLPRGWSLHLSTDPVSAGRLFFTSPNGKTSWELPLEISIELDVEQKQRIRKLYARWLKQEAVAKSQETCDSASVSRHRGSSGLSNRSSGASVDDSSVGVLRPTSLSSAVEGATCDAVLQEDVLELRSPLPQSDVF